MAPAVKDILERLNGDKKLWAVVLFLAVISFLPVYSASSNLAYLGSGTGNTSRFLIKHFLHISIGIAIMFFVHKLPYLWFRGISYALLPIMYLLLIWTMSSGTTIEGANASRWVKIPIINMSFQTSTFASFTLMIYVARYLASKRHEVITLKHSLLNLWLPVGFALGLILPSNFSTTAIIFCMVWILCFLGGYPIKYLFGILVLGLVGLFMFILLAKAFPDALPNRVDTWISRIESFAGSGESQNDYQIEKAKIAIASGELTGMGPGKSMQKNFLPQSSSDFIFAIIIEEYGFLIGAVPVMFLYLYLLFRIVMIARKADTIFGRLLVLGIGMPIVFQALINMAVAVELFPVTGQPLPLISSGGSSMWMTCAGIGLILAVSSQSGNGGEEIKEETDEGDLSEESPLDILSKTI